MGRGKDVVGDCGWELFRESKNMLNLAGAVLLRGLVGVTEGVGGPAIRDRRDWRWRAEGDGSRLD